MIINMMSSRLRKFEISPIHYLSCCTLENKINNHSVFYYTCDPVKSELYVYCKDETLLKEKDWYIIRECTQSDSESDDNSESDDLKVKNQSFLIRLLSTPNGLIGLTIVLILILSALFADSSYTFLI